MELDEYVTGTEAAQILGIDQSTVSRWSDIRLRDDQRRLTPVGRIGGQRGYKLFRRTDVEQLRDELAAEANR